MANSVKLITEKRDSNNEHRNEIMITGTVSGKRKIEGANVVILTIATSGSSSISNFPRVVWHGDLAEAVDKSIDADQRPRVCIKAAIQTMKKTVEGQEARYFQNIVGESISFAPTVMETTTGKDGIGSRFVADENMFTLLGDIVHKYTFTNEAGSRIGTILTIRTVTNGHLNFPKVSVFGRLLDIADNAEVGDTVCVTGHVQTKFSENGGSRRRYETLVGTDLAIL